MAMNPYGNLMGLSGAVRGGGPVSYPGASMMPAHGGPVMGGMGSFPAQGGFPPAYGHPVMGGLGSAPSQGGMPGFASPIHGGMGSMGGYGGFPPANPVGPAQVGVGQWGNYGAGGFGMQPHPVGPLPSPQPVQMPSNLQPPQPIGIPARPVGGGYGSMGGENPNLNNLMLLRRMGAF